MTDEEGVTEATEEKKKGSFLGKLMKIAIIGAIIAAVFSSCAVARARIWTTSSGRSFHRPRAAEPPRPSGVSSTDRANEATVLCSGDSNTRGWTSPDAFEVSG